MKVHDTEEARILGYDQAPPDDEVKALKAEIQTLRRQLKAEARRHTPAMMTMKGWEKIRTYRERWKSEHQKAAKYEQAYRENVGLRVDHERVCKLLVEAQECRDRWAEKYEELWHRSRTHARD